MTNTTVDVTEAVADFAKKTSNTAVSVGENVVNEGTDILHTAKA